MNKKNIVRQNIISLLKNIPSLRIYIGLIIALAIGLVLIVTLLKHPSEYVTGTLTGLFIALIGALFVMLYQEATRGMERLRRRDDLLRGIHVELMESLEYLQGLFADPNPKAKELNFIPSFPRTAWDMACASGEIDLSDELSHRLKHVYATLQNFNFLAKQAMDVTLFSTRPANEGDTIAKGLIELLKKMHVSLLPIAEEAKSELEMKLGISPDRVAQLQAELKKRILSLRDTPIVESGREKNKD